MKYRCIIQMYNMMAISAFSPIILQPSNSTRMSLCVHWHTEWTDMWTSWRSGHFKFILSTHTHSHTIWGLQTDGAKSGYCQYDCETRLQSLTCHLDYCCSKSLCVICHILPHGGALFLNFVYAHSGAYCILMIVASKFSVYAEHHYCICNEYFVFVL